MLSPAVITIVHLGLLAFIIIAGFTQANLDNARPFTPDGVDGIIDASAQVFFSFVGYDAVANAAVEVSGVPPPLFPPSTHTHVQKNMN